MCHSTLHKAVTVLLLDQIVAECRLLCQNSDVSVFRHVPTSEFSEFQLETCIGELQLKAPLLHQILSTIASCNDHHNL